MYNLEVKDEAVPQTANTSLYNWVKITFSLQTRTCSHVHILRLKENGQDGLFFASGVKNKCHASTISLFL